MKMNNIKNQNLFKFNKKDRIVLQRAHANVFSAICTKFLAAGCCQ